MRQKLPDVIEENRVGGEPGWHSGKCYLKCGNARLTVIFSDGHGWDHVSISLRTRCPTWDEMNWVKDKFFDPEEAVMQLHPPRSTWVNNWPYCLHLWRPQSAREMEQLKDDWGAEWDDRWEPPGVIPLPPAWMVGDPALGNLKKVR